MSLGAWIGLALLGGVGAVARDIGERHASLFAVNIVGAFALGALSGTTGDPRFLLGTGFLGAFTSFSGWALRPRAEAILALLVGLLACALGRALF